MKHSVFPVVVSFVLLSACTPSGMTTAGGSSSSASSVVENTSSAMVQDSSDTTVQASSDPVVRSSAAASSVAAVTGVRVIAVQAANFSFTPNTIMAKKGEKVQIVLTGVSGIHGFAVPGLGINQRIEAGQTVTVNLPTDTAGTFQAFCSIPCGPGHREMQATVVIQ